MNNPQHGSVIWIKSAAGVMIFSLIAVAVSVMMVSHNFAAVAPQGAVSMNTLAAQVGPAMICAAISSGLFTICLIVILVSAICYFQTRQTRVPAPARS
jgi:hypothetical protein